jgi:hypothetical protein
MVLFYLYYISSVLLTCICSKNVKSTSRNLHNIKSKNLFCWRREGAWGLEVDSQLFSFSTLDAVDGQLYVAVATPSKEPTNRRLVGL